MHEEVRDLRSEIEELKRFAERGRDVPLVSGSYFLVWGLVIGIAAIIARYQLLEGGRLGVGFIWAGAVGIGWLASFMLTRALGIRSRDGGSAFGNQVTHAVWVAAGITIAGYLAVHLLGAALLTMSTVALLVSGMAIVATAAASESRVMYVSGAGLILAGLLAAVATLTSPDRLLIVAIAAFFFLAGPGLYLVARYSRLHR